MYALEDDHGKPELYSLPDGEPMEYGCRNRCLTKYEFYGVGRFKILGESLISSGKLSS